MKYFAINSLAVMFVLLCAVTTNAVAVNEPYVPDRHFNDGQPIYELFDTTGQAVITGQKLLLDFWNGDTVMAGLVPVTEAGQTRYTVVLARYGSDGQHKTWSSGTPGAVSPSKKYVYVPYDTAPDNVRAVAVRDVALGTNSDILVLIDSRDVTTGARTKSVLAVFSQYGKFRGVVTHMAQADVDNVGGSIVGLGGPIMIVSSQPSVDAGPTGARMILKRYRVDFVNGEPALPALDTTFGTNGRVDHTIAGCTKTVGGTNPPVTLPIPCDLRVESSYTNSNSWLFIAGDFGNFHANASGQDPNYSRDLFVMKLVTQTGARDTTFDGDGLATYATANPDAALRGMVVRRDFTTPIDIFLLNAFPRACRNGFNVVHLNASTGAYINRSTTIGGGNNADPNVCAHTGSFDGNDMALSSNGRYLGVAGRRFSGEEWSGINASIALLQPDNLLSTPHQQDFTDNSGQWAGHSVFNAIIRNSWLGHGNDDLFTAAGTHYGYYEYPHDDPYSAAMTLRVQPDRIFRNGLEN